MSEIKTIEQAADEVYPTFSEPKDAIEHQMNVRNKQHRESYIAGAKAQKELSDAREKLLLDVISEMQKSLKYYGKDTFDRVCFLDHATCEENYGADARDTLSSVAKKLEGL